MYGVLWITIFFGHEWDDLPMIFTDDAVTSENHWWITTWVTKNIVIHSNSYVILFFTLSYLVYNTGKWCKLSLTHHLFVMGLSVVVLWRHTCMYCDVILTNCPQNFPIDVRAFSCYHQVDYYSSIGWLACKKKKHSNFSNYVSIFHKHTVKHRDIS